ncbi:MAG: cytochrome P450 [Pseudomonadota bacterium]|nr:cytochrome P450 [Pseudomonadota bacterium]
MSGGPESDIDLFDAAAIENPYPLYQRLRDLGPAVWLTKNQMWCLPRYKEVRDTLFDWRRFTTSRGVAMDNAVNEATSGPGRANSLTSDPPLHDEIRRITGAPLQPRALESIKDRIVQTAHQIVADVCARKSVDGMKDIAQVLPLTVVSDLVGLPDHGRESMLRWAAATFNAMGPMNQLGVEALPQIRELHQFCIKDAVPGKLKPDGWAARIYEAASRGEVAVEQCPGMMREYIGPALDTTIFGIGHLLRLLGENPEQWALLRADRSLVPHAINEALRMEAPVRSFTRYVREEATFGDVTIAQGGRLMVLYGSANRDERKWARPDAFDITRRPSDHLAFGYGIHACGGMHLARMEIAALLNAMLDRIVSFTVGAPKIVANNTLRGYESLPVTLTVN